ncbi:hypothetical protein [Candidatus Aalborgicola defluviihabitans]|uniref:hypothetical protein n=1 Tax=Candidatus Aalborgicola defluviihabitans TaxID=3386187 RepID=UPI001D9CB8EC|nr:hypothetical protein [Burkholderiales bacterium]
MFKIFTNSFMRSCILLLVCAGCQPAFAEDHWSVNFYGYLKHVDREPGYREGGMDYFGVSKEASYEAYQFDSGANTFIDTFGKRSYSVFSDVSHADFVYGMLTPMLRLTCIHKGRGSDTSRMVTNCYAVPKIRIGARTGLFADVTLIPQIGDYADAMGMVEFGYKW